MRAVYACGTFELKLRRKAHCTQKGPFLSKVGSRPSGSEPLEPRHPLDVVLLKAAPKVGIGLREATAFESRHVTGWD